MKLEYTSESSNFGQHKTINWHMPYIQQQPGPFDKFIIPVCLLHNKVPLQSHGPPSKLRLLLNLVEQYTIKLVYI